MDNNWTTKRIFDTRSEGKRRVGRSKLSWRDNVDQDIRLLGERNLKSLALNREEGNKFLKKASAHAGLRSQ
jgi:hypothetical protein